MEDTTKPLTTTHSFSIKLRIETFDHFQVNPANRMTSQLYIDGTPADVKSDKVS